MIFRYPRSMADTVLNGKIQSDQVKQTVTILVVAPFGRMRNSLVAFLLSLPNNEIVTLLDELSGVEQVISQTIPDVLIIDADISVDDSAALIQKLKLEYPALKIIAIVDSLSHQCVLQEAGAHHVFLKWLMDDSFRKAVMG